MSQGFEQRAAALVDRAERPAPASWRPDDASKGHAGKLVGELVRYEQNHTSYGPCRIAVLRDPVGVEWSVLLLHTVLRNEFEKLRPKRGELVYVGYLGRKRPAGGGAEYEAYKVVVDRDGVDWGDPVAATFADASAGAHPPVAAAVICGECGYAEPDHAAGCPNELPF
jgi:hypothetical protein